MDMKIYPINYSYNLQNYVKNNYSNPGSFNTPLKYDTVNFSGWFGINSQSKKNDYLQLSAGEMILSYKLADMLHRLDNKSMIVIGNSDDLCFKDEVKIQLDSEYSFVDNPKDIENIYVLKENLFKPIFIIKDKKDGFKIHCLARKNPTKPAENLLEYIRLNSAMYGDFIETEDNCKIQFVKTSKESKQRLYDAKYSADSFLNPSEDSNYAAEDVCEENSLKFQSNVIPYRTFDDVAGMDKTIKQVKKSILFPMVYPKAFPKNTNCGTILYGPPGTGKTLLAFAVIGEVKKRTGQDVHFIHIKSKDLERSLFGESEKLWRNVFKELQEHQPSLLFIDEIDSILESRQEGGNYVVNNNTVSQFLTLIDTIEKNQDRVWIIGTTNRLERIDSAIKRKGRLGELIEIKEPDEKGCLDILNFYLKGKNISQDFNREIFAKKIHKLKYTGADIANMVNQARDNAYEREGIYSQMDDGSFVDKKLDDLEYISQDFYKCLDQKPIERRSAGFL